MTRTGGDGVPEVPADAEGDPADGPVTERPVRRAAGRPSPHDDRADVAGHLVGVAGGLLRLLRRETPVPLGPGSLSVLIMLVRTGPLRLGDLSIRQGVAPPTLTRMITSLEVSGYVERQPDPVDRRAVTVHVTPAGETLVRDVVSMRSAVLAERLARLDAASVAAITAAVPALTALVDEDL